MSSFSKGQCSNAREWTLEKMKKVPEKLIQLELVEATCNARDCDIS